MSMHGKLLFNVMMGAGRGVIDHEFIPPAIGATVSAHGLGIDKRISPDHCDRYCNGIVFAVFAKTF